MRRLIVIGSLFIVMMSILSGCTLDSSSSSPRSSSPVASTVNNSSETYPEVEPTEPILYHDLKMLTSSMGIGTTCSTETGFYELDLSEMCIRDRHKAQGYGSEISNHCKTSIFLLKCR